MTAIFLLTFLVSTGETVWLPEDTRSEFISGDYSALVEANDKLYAASGYGLAEMDPGFLEVRHVMTSGYSQKIAASAGKIWVASGSSVVEFNVNEGLSGTASFPLKGKVSALEACDKFLASATDSGVLVISFTSSVSSPFLTASLGGAVEDLVFSGDYLYATTKEGIKIFSTGQNPALIRELSLPGSKTVAAGSGKLFVGLSVGTIVVFSLKDQESPREELRFEAGASPVSLACFGKRLYAAQGYQGYAVFDFQGKRLDKPLTFLEGYISDILPTKKGAYLALAEKGIVLLEGKDPPTFAVVNRFSRLSPVLHTSRSGDFWAIAQGRGGVSIVKQEPDSLVKGFADPRPENALGVLLSGTNLYIGDQSRGVFIHSLKTFPVAEEKYNLFQPGSPLRFGLSGDIILSAEEDKGLRTLWICPCGPLKDKGKLDGINAVDVAVVDSIAYVADPDSGLRIVALREEGKTVEELSIYPGAVSPVALLLEGQKLFVADSVGALVILDIKDPVSPKQLSFTAIGVRPYGLALSGSTLYVASGEKGVLEISVADPAAPVPGDFIDTPGKALAVAVSETHLGVADYTSWLLVPLSGRK